MRPLILGSSSPRRIEIFSLLKIPFQQASPPFDEKSVPFSGDQEDYVRRISEGKAESLIKQYPDEWIITSDTAVFLDDRCYGKPQNFEEAHRFLCELSGKSHTVITAITLRKNQTIRTESESTTVTFNPLNPEQLKILMKTYRWSDKAGAYAIQESGSLIVNKINGCFYNVMGMPVNTLRRMLEKEKINLWEYLR